jgi:uncharacterized protein
MDPRVSVLGFLVGLLIGLTGIGGGAVMTPLLILLGLAKPVVAVGTDLMWNLLTKFVGAAVHYRQGNVDFKIVKRLAIGSVPGALAGLVVLSRIHHNEATADSVVTRMLGITLVCVAASLLFRLLRTPSPKTISGPRTLWSTALVGGVVALLVSLTSVGSGSLIVACLVVLYPALPLRRIIGSDIFHALILVGVSALGHAGIGSIDFRLLGGLLLGSLPGVWLGSKLTGTFPEKLLRPILASTLFLLGCKLL